jgi:hypothetical protein
MTPRAAAQYQGLSALLLDDYYPLPDNVSHMERLAPGVIHAKGPEGLSSEFFEMRSPARLYLVTLADIEGNELGLLTTGAGAPVAEVLSDLCHALADGSAVLHPCPPMTRPAPLAATACLIPPANLGSGAVLVCHNLPFMSRLRAAVDAESLALDLSPALPRAEPSMPARRPP